jgi:hypothetical protein
VWHLQTSVDQVPQCDAALTKFLKRFNLQNAAKKFATLGFCTMNDLKALDRSTFDKMVVRKPCVSNFIWDALHQACVCRNRLPAM